MDEFQIALCTHTIDNESQMLIAQLVLAWARYDSLVTQWTYRSFNMSADEGSIFIGNMDTKTKLDRLKALYKHFGITESVERITEIAKNSKIHADVRNTICHKSCGGHSKNDPDRLIFSNGKIYPQLPGKMMVELIHLDQIRDAIGFASSTADGISAQVDALIALQEEWTAQHPAGPPSSPADLQRD